MPKLFISLLSPAVATDEGYRVSSAWMIQEDDGRTRARGETDFRGLSELIDPDTEWLQTPGNIVVTVPGEHALSLTCEVPGRSAGQVRRALPFVVEEFVTTDIESMHLAHGELRRGAPIHVCLVDRTLLDDWLACLAALYIRPGYVFSEAELLPVVPDQASVLLDGDRVLVRTPEQAAVIDRDNLGLAANALHVGRAVIAYGTLTDLERGELSQDLEVDTTQSSAAETLLEFVAENWRNPEAVNLLQGAYRPRQQTNPLWQRWRPVAALLAIWVGVVLVTMTAEAFYASHQADGLEAASESLYREIFPDERRVTNVRRQLQAKLGERPDGAGLGLIELLGPLASAMTQDMRIQSLNYTEDRSELAVDMQVGAYDMLDRLKDSMGGAGVEVEIVTAEQMDRGVRARLRLRGQGGGP